MDRWQKLRAVVLEFEDAGRRAGREGCEEQIRKLENALQHKVRQCLDLERTVDDERAQFVQRLESELSRIKQLEEEVVLLRTHVLAQRFKTDEDQKSFLAYCEQGNSDALQDILGFRQLHEKNDENNHKVAEVIRRGLNMAVYSDSLECCEILLRSGGDPTWRDSKTRQTLLHRAVSAPSLSDEILRRLLAESRVRSMIEVTDSSGMTPLALAVQLLRVQKVICLISNGAALDTISRDDWVRFEDYRRAQKKDTEPAANVTDIESTQPNLILIDNIPQSFEESIEEMSNQAELLYHEEHFEDALKVYSALEEKTKGQWSDENRATLFYNMARTCFKLRRMADSVDWCDKVLAVFANNQDALSQRAEARASLFDFARAALDFETLADLDVEGRVHWLRSVRQMHQSQRCLDDLYGILRLAPTCSAVEIRKAYHEASRKWHPDKNRGSRDCIIRSEIMFKAVSHAYFVLSDDLRRAQYEASRLASKFESHVDDYEQYAEETFSVDQEDENSSNYNGAFAAGERVYYNCGGSYCSDDIKEFSSTEEDDNTRQSHEQSDQTSKSVISERYSPFVSGMGAQQRSPTDHERFPWT